MHLAHMSRHHNNGILGVTSTAGHWMEVFLLLYAVDSFLLRSYWNQLLWLHTNGGAGLRCNLHHKGYVVWRLSTHCLVLAEFQCPKGASRDVYLSSSSCTRWTPSSASFTVQLYTLLFIPYLSGPLLSSIIVPVAFKGRQPFSRLVLGRYQAATQ